MNSTSPRRSRKRWLLSCRARGTTGRPGSASSRRAGPAAPPCSPRGRPRRCSLRISPSPDWFEDIEPLASTKPATPVGREVVDDVLHPGEVGVAHRRHAVLPRASSRSRSPPQSLTLKGGLARMKSALRSGKRSSWNAVAVGDCAVDAADGEVHLRQPPGGVVRLLAVDRDVALRLPPLPLPCVRADELHRLHEHAARAAAGVVDAAAGRARASRPAA
ncbi:MAG: hypothetical protein KatS3mg082_2194 [Nitrospiraceae bacterium]|nr:MAG: hypothetical protein KatS3mg082_2194 [Nitrospiraceae bacterium]